MESEEYMNRKQQEAEIAEVSILLLLIIDTIDPKNDTKAAKRAWSNIPTMTRQVLQGAIHGRIQMHVDILPQTDYTVYEAVVRQRIGQRATLEGCSDNDDDGGDNNNHNNGDGDDSGGE